jgi:Ca2+-binding EF-hand superfamily protein
MTATILLALAAQSGPLAPRADASAVDVVLPGPVRLRVEAPAGSDWETFLDKLFDHFDRDDDGTLSSAEAGRVFPLPLPGGKEAPAPGRCTRTEFRDHYRRAGFAPIVGVARPPAAGVGRTSAALFRALDRDADGTLSRDELGRAVGLLRRFDENEDDALTPAELIASVPAESSPGEAAVRIEPVAGPADIAVRAEPGRFVTPDGRAEVRVTAAAGDGFRTAKDFYLAQFADALGGRPALRTTDADADPGLRAVADMFAAADRDGDGRLTAAELGGFLDLVSLGVGCQTVVTVEDRGGSLFDRLDADADGRLDGAELTRAAALPPAERANPVGQYRVEVSRGPVGPTFGPVPTPSKAEGGGRRAEPGSPPSAPGWFRAMDRTGDGFVSAAEFRGPPTKFAALDRDGDGRISPAEAGRE